MAMLRFFVVLFIMFTADNVCAESAVSSDNQIQPLKRTSLQQSKGQYYLCVDFNEDVKFFPRIHISNSCVNLILSFNKNIIAPPSRHINHRIVKSIEFAKFGPASLLMTIKLVNYSLITHKRYTKNAIMIGFRVHKKPTIIIDPGHGGQDYGSRSVTGNHEKNITLVMAIELMQMLRDSGRYNVSLTRDSDRSVSLKKRRNIVHAKRGDLLISLHADGSSNTQVRGISIHTLPILDLSKKTAAPSDVNEANYDKNLQMSRKFAETLTAYIPNNCKLQQRTCGNSRLKVLQINRPAVLVECGNLSNRKDNNLLHSKKFRDRTNKAILYALDAFFEREIK
jgi:N-acetylmuramoyl-L-alanine amidase